MSQFVLPFRVVQNRTQMVVDLFFGGEIFSLDQAEPNLCQAGERSIRLYNLYFGIFHRLRQNRQTQIELNKQPGMLSLNRCKRANPDEDHF